MGSGSGSVGSSTCYATCHTHRQHQHRTLCPCTVCSNAAGGTSGSLQGSAGAAAHAASIASPKEP